MSKNTFDIELNGETYTCRTTFEAIEEFEDRTNMSIDEAYKTLAIGKLKFSIIAAAVWAGINGQRSYLHEKPLLYPVVGEMVKEHGFHLAALYAARFFTDAFPPAKDEPQEVGEQKKSSESTTDISQQSS